MNSSYYQHQLDLKRKVRAAALKRASDLGLKQADKQGKATRKAASAGKANSPSVGKSRLRTAQRYEKEANTAAAGVSTLMAKAAKLERRSPS
ncbi:hypothetical protein [Streptomyces anulatus]|uniref:hypothetical protein n=1 Tax=Streptomyces anulatus TaxID=1892 RepID=UPI002E0D9C46|nr:hypothetical protein OG557_29630 [Streptomyces anulatus]